MKKLILTFTAIVAIASGCTKEKSEDLIPNNQVISSNEDLSILAKEPVFIICQWDEWGRASKDCHKWGLCNFEWFPEGRISNHSAQIKRDLVSGEYYMDILFTSNSPKAINGIPISSENLPLLSTLPIDSDITIHTLTSGIGRNLVAKAGTYPFNQSLGNFGGYRIWFL
jgi:hypothetical protein